MSVRVRFAPSPTGYLHVGGARTALYNHLFARGQGGTLVLRIEDTDAARSTEESVRAILDSLRWLGLEWDEGPGKGGPYGPYFQSERRDRYRAHAEALLAAGRAFPCFCTPEELEQRRAAQVDGAADGPRLDTRCRALDAAGRAALRAEGRPEAVRFAHEDRGETAWDDVVRGRVAFQDAVLDDFILLRSDGLPTYNFACVVDDHEMDITHVIRGDDHISNTPRQLLIYRALGWQVPVFAHVPMILGSDGARLSKRHGATSVEAFRELGLVPEALVNFLALLGWSPGDDREVFSLAELEQVFRLERVGANPAVFDLQKLEWMNGQHLKRMDEATRVRAVESYLIARGHDLLARSPEWREAFVRALGDRLRTLADAESYGAFALLDTVEADPEAWAELMARPEAGPRLRRLAERLRDDPEFSLASVEALTRGLAGELGVKAGELMGSARVALTGRKFAPGLFDVITLLGRERAVSRLVEAAVAWERGAVAGGPSGAA
jgi:nondiscriminating glutamyl-tRNA synthetase